MRPVTRALGLACLLIVLVSGTVWSVRRVVGDLYLEAGNRLLVERKRSEGTVAVEKALAWDPRRSAIARRLGDVLKDSYLDLPGQGTGKTSEEGRSLLRRSLSAYLRAIDREPGDAWSWSSVGEVYGYLAAEERRGRGIDLGRFALEGRQRLLPAERLAMAAVEKAISLEPNNYEYHDQRAALLDSLGLRKEALEEYHRSATILPMYSLHGWPRPDALDGQKARVIQQGFEAALDTNPFVPRDEKLRNIGETALDRGDDETAQKFLAQSLAAARDPVYALSLHYLLGTLEERQGREEEALASFTRALAHPALAATARARRGEIYLRQGNVDAAFSELRQAVGLNPDDPYFRLSLARAAEATGRDDLAAESLKMAASMMPRDPEPLRKLVDFYRRKAQPAQAAAAARRLVEGWPGTAEYQRLLEDFEPVTQ